jgi:tetratricopeptide (TPR) repeat protein
MFSMPGYIDKRINNHIEWGYKFDKAHNEFLDILANTGIFSLIIYLLILFFVFKQSFFCKEADEKSKLLGIILLSLFLTNLFSFSCVTVALYFWLTLSLLIVRSHSSKTNLKTDLKYLILLAIIILLAIVVLLDNWAKIYLANIYYNKGDLENAVKYNPNIDRYHGELSLQFLRDGKIAEAIDEANKSVQANKVDADNYRVVTMVLGDIDQNKTLSAFDTAIKLEPTNPKIYLEKARYYLKINLKDKARECLKKASELKNNYSEAENLLETIK